MTWGLAAIKGAYDKGAKNEEFSHLIISHNTFDFDQMSTYVLAGDDPRVTWENSEAKKSGHDRIDEVYRFSLGWESQSKERRAMHWEFEPNDTDDIRLNANESAYKQDIMGAREPEALMAFAALHDLRNDWHEPDNSSVNARVVGDHLDNAMGHHIDQKAIDENYQELVVILTVDGVDALAVNLANLLAWASTPKE